MIIDFHTHIFPDKLAQSTIKLLSERANIRPYTDATLGGLRKSMKDAGVTHSVVLPVVTSPKHFESIIGFAAELDKNEDIIAFGGVHPDSDNYRQELKRIKDLGLKGIKLHPDYQDTYIDDTKYLRMIDYATQLDLWIVTRAGIDVGFPDSMKCTPKLVNNVLKQVETNKLILAHMGGWGCWNEVEELLLGKDLYLDAAFCLGKISDKRFIDMTYAHGVDRVLFATDSPWCGQKEDLNALRNLDIPEEDKEKIMGGNAARILNLTE